MSPQNDRKHTGSIYMTHCLYNETAGHQNTPGSPHRQVPEEPESKREPKPATVAPDVCQVTEHTISVPRKRGQGMVPLKPTVRSRSPVAPSSCRGRGQVAAGPLSYSPCQSRPHSSPHSRSLSWASTGWSSGSGPHGGSLPLKVAPAPPTSHLRSTRSQLPGNYAKLWENLLEGPPASCHSKGPQ